MERGIGKVVDMAEWKKRKQGQVPKIPGKADDNPETEFNISKKTGEEPSGFDIPKSRLTHLEKRYENIMIRFENTRKTSPDLMDAARRLKGDLLAFSMPIKSLLARWKSEEFNLSQPGKKVAVETDDIAGLYSDIAEAEELLKRADEMRRELLVKFPERLTPHPDDRTR